MNLRNPPDDSLICVNSDVFLHAMRQAGFRFPLFLRERGSYGIIQAAGAVKNTMNFDRSAPNDVETR